MPMNRVQTIPNGTAFFAGYKNLFPLVKDITLTIYKTQANGPFVAGKLISIIRKYGSKSDYSDNLNESRTEFLKSNSRTI